MLETEPVKNNNRKWIAAAAALLALTAGAYLFVRNRHAGAMAEGGGKGAGGLSGAAGEENTQAKVFAVEKVRFSDAIEGLIGTVRGETIELTFGGVEENISAAHVQVGQTVKKGEMLFELDYIRAEARKSQSEIALKECGCSNPWAAPP